MKVTLDLRCPPDTSKEQIEAILIRQLGDARTDPEGLLLSISYETSPAPGSKS